MEELASRLRLFRSHGMTTLTWDRHRGHAASYDVVAQGYNYRLDEPRAALATARLRQLDAQNDQRRELDTRYRLLLADIPGLSVTRPPGPGLSSSHHLFTVVLDEGIEQDRFRAVLAEDRIQTSVHYPPIHRFSIYREGAPDLPLTDAYAARTVSLPMFAHMTFDQQDLVVAATRKASAGMIDGPPLFTAGGGCSVGGDRHAWEDDSRELRQ